MNGLQKGLKNRLLNVEKKKSLIESIEHEFIDDNEIKRKGDRDPIDASERKEASEINHDIGQNRGSEEKYENDYDDGAYAHHDDDDDDGNDNCSGSKESVVIASKSKPTDIKTTVKANTTANVKKKHDNSKIY